MSRPLEKRPPSELASPAAAATPLEKGEEKEAKQVYLTWGTKITWTHKEQLAEMIETAPRHVRMQDLVGYILTEFFSQHQELPEELRQRKSRPRPARP